MPQCLACPNTFPNRLPIDGKVRSLQNRLYCLTCSPFGSRNTKRLHAPDIPLGVQKTSGLRDLTCSACGDPYLWKGGMYGTSTLCGPCLSSQQRATVKSNAVAYKGGKCSICGYDRCLQALVFHHLDPSKKDFSISGNHTRSWKSVREELDKCVLVCSNCHSEIHAKVTVLPLDP